MKMEVRFIEDFPFHVSLENVMKKMHMRADHPYVARVEEHLREAMAIAKPKALYSLARVDEIGSDHVTIEGVTMKSKAMGKNLEGESMVYPYLCTCGLEIASYAESFDDMMDRFIMDAIMELILMEARLAMVADLENSLEKGKSTSSISPGSLVDWPVLEQKKLFRLFQGGDERIGVSLTKSCLMQPVKSVSGIRYVSDHDFHNCDLCQRKGCPSRQSPFDPSLYEKSLGD